MQGLNSSNGPCREFPKGEYKYEIGARLRLSFRAENQMERQMGNCMESGHL